MLSPFEVFMFPHIRQQIIEELFQHDMKYRWIVYFNDLSAVRTKKEMIDGKFQEERERLDEFGESYAGQLMYERGHFYTCSVLNFCKVLKVDGTKEINVILNKFRRVHRLIDETVRHVIPRSLNIEELQNYLDIINSNESKIIQTALIHLHNISEITPNRDFFISI